MGTAAYRCPACRADGEDKLVLDNPSSFILSSVGATCNSCNGFHDCASGVTCLINYEGLENAKTDEAYREFYERYPGMTGEKRAAFVKEKLPKVEILFDLSNIGKK